MTQRSIVQNEMLRPLVYKGCTITQAGKGRVALTYDDQENGPSYFTTMFDAVRAVDAIFNVEA